MAISNTDKAPGTNVSIQDGQLRVQRPEPGTKLTILGTTTSQAIALNDPLYVDSVPRYLRALRHPDGTPSELSIALAEAVRSGARNIEVVKIHHSSGEIPGVLTDNDRFDALETTYSDLRQHNVDFLVPVNAHVDATGLSGTSPDGWSRNRGFRRQLGDFCYLSTKEWNACFGVIGVRPLTQVALDEAWTGAPTNRAEVLFNDPTLAQLKEWVYHLEGANGSMVNHSAEGLLTGHVHGSVEEAYGQVSALYDGWAYEDDGTPAVDRNNVAVDGASYIAITAMTARQSHDEVQPLANANNVPTQVDMNVLSAGAVGYGALLTQLDAHEATTNKRIPGYSPGRRMNLTLGETLMRLRYTTLVNRSGSYVVLKDVTAGYNASKYTRTDFNLVSTRRIMHAMVKIVRERGFRYIGGPIDSARMVAMEGDIASALDAMKPSGAVRSYDIFVNSSPDEQVLGEVNVEISAVIGFELTRINAFLQLQKPDAFASA